jgi:histidyl-tRNA synthetase
VVFHCGGGSFKSQMKKADASGARLAVIIGEDEAREGSASLKPLREDSAAEARAAGRLAEAIGNYLFGDGQRWQRL